VIASPVQPRSRPRRRREAALGALAAAALFAACGGGNGASTSPTASTAATAARTTTTASAALVARLRAPGHEPKAGGHWPIAVTLSWQGRPARGHVSYQFLLGGQVVSRQQVGGESPDFTGTFHDDILWPASAVGFPLTFRVVVTSPHGTRRLDYPVRVQQR
jgi:hypothetical protein